MLRALALEMMAPVGRSSGTPATCNSWRSRLRTRGLVEIHSTAARKSVATVSDPATLEEKKICQWTLPHRDQLEEKRTVEEC